MYRITKEFRFEAAHHLTKVPENHKCRRPHGHSYRVILELESEELDERGFVVDYADLDQLKRFIDENLDHRDLNEVLSGSDSLSGIGEPLETTAESLAYVLWRVAKQWWPGKISCVRVSETAKTWAEYRP